MSSLSIAVRGAKPSDIAVILELIRLKAAFDGCFDELIATDEEITRAFFGASPLIHAILAEVKGQVAGFATCYPIYSIMNCKPGLWLDDLYVREEFRQQGVGRALLAGVAAKAEAEGCARIDWTVALANQNGKQFYTHMGARLTEEVRFCWLDRRTIRKLAAPS